MMIKQSRWLIYLFIVFVCPAGSEILETIDAIVNDELILSGEVDEQLRLRLQNAKGGQLSEEQLETERSKLVHRMIDELLIVQEARKILSQKERDALTQKIEQLTNREMTQYRIRFSTPQELAQEERRLGMTWEDLRRARYRENERAYLRNIVAPQLTRRSVSPPTPEEIEQFQKDHPTTRPSDEITIAHILLRLAPDAAPSEEQSIVQKAHEILLLARANEPFDKLVRQYSQHDESRNLGGVLPAFKKGQFLKEFDQVFELDEGAISEPIRTHLGYHIVKVMDKQTIEDLILRQKREQITLEWLQKLRSKANITSRQGTTLQQYVSQQGL